MLTHSGGMLTCDLMLTCSEWHVDMQSRVNILGPHVDMRSRVDMLGGHVDMGSHVEMLGWHVDMIDHCSALKRQRARLRCSEISAGLCFAGG